MRFFLLLYLVTIPFSAISQEKIVDEIRSIYEGNGELVPFAKLSYQYDQKERQVAYYQFQWDKNSRDWQLKYLLKTQYQADSSTTEESWRWKKYPDSLQYYSNYSRIYNKQNQLTQIISLSRDFSTSGSTYSNSYQLNYYYNTFGCKVKEDQTSISIQGNIFKISTVYKVNDNCQLVQSSTPYELKKFDYDGNLLVRERSYSIRQDTSLYYEKINRYNSKDQLTYTEVLGGERQFIFYNGEGKAIRYLSEYSSNKGKSWTPYYEALYDYSNKNEMTYESYSNWIVLGNLWEYKSTSKQYLNATGTTDSARFIQYQKSLGGYTIISKQVDYYTKRCDELPTVQTSTRTSSYEPSVTSVTNFTYAKPARCEDVQFNLFNFFPNPARGWLQVLLNESKGDISIQIFSSLGKLEKSYFYQTPVNLILLDVSDISPGVYLLQVGSEKSFESKRLVLN